MKKFVCLLAVLALAAPVFAGDITLTATADNTGNITIGYTSTGSLPVGFGLIVDAGAATVTQYVSGDSFFDVFIDVASENPAGYVIGQGDPVADPAAAGIIALPQSKIALCMGALNATQTPPASSANLATIKADCDASVSIDLDPLRGGIVDTDGNPMNVTNTLPIVVANPCGPVDCLKATAPEYALWVQWNKPACWCFKRQCNGDADGLKNGPFYVALPDLTILRGAFNKADAAIPAGGICANFNHAKDGPFQVALADLTILRGTFNKADALVKCCDANQDCVLDAGDKYASWTN